MMRNRIIVFLAIFSIILGVTFVVYSQPEPVPSFPNTPFMSYYLRQDYTIQSNGTATITGIVPVVIWLNNYVDPGTIVMAERDGVSPITYSEVNLFGLTTNSTKPFFWWLPPWLPIGFTVNMSGNIGLIIGETELSVQQMVRDTKIFFSSSSNRTFIANYDANSGFLVQLEIRDGNTISIYQLQSSLGVSLGISKYYYARAIFLCLFVPSLVAFLLMLPWPLKKWSQSLLKFLRQEI
ncbi:MAG: hypothetical protein QXO71_01980 [Candidatus Jordarchaeaceae archaeon]